MGCDGRPAGGGPMGIAGLRLRGILDSRAEVTVEAELTLDGGATGRGSCPRAIAPGRRERPIGPPARLGALPDVAARVLAVLGAATPDGFPAAAAGRPPAAAGLPAAGAGRDGAADQAAVDARLDAALDVLGAGTALAVSLAFARARAEAGGVALWRYLAELAGTRPAIPRLLVNVFSGGIHTGGAASGYQQVMVIPQTGGLAGDIEAACRVWDAAAAEATRRFGPPRLSASSGLLLPLDSAGQLALLDGAITRCGLAGEVGIGVDVAAEHLLDGDRYRLGGRALRAAELADVLVAEAGRYAIGYLEDPFDPADEAAWRALRGRLPPRTRVVGDDLFATDAARVSPDLADGVLLKPSQIGTVSGLVAAALRARRAGMTIAVSHRSGETDDTLICDVATALGADLIKVGGPRRGDRIAKYNQLLRLAEEVPCRQRPGEEETVRKRP